MPVEELPEGSQLQSPRDVLELTQTGQQNLLTLQQRLALVLDGINCARRHKHVHELVVIYSKQLKSKR
jgi:hypothetical protein